MNAGKNRDKAIQQAQVNANLTGTPRWVHLYNGVYWISKTPVEHGERTDPQSPLLARRQGAQ